MKKYLPILIAILLIAVIILAVFIAKSKYNNDNYSVTVESYNRSSSNSQVVINPEG